MEGNRSSGCNIHLSAHDRAVLGRIFSPHLPSADIDETGLNDVNDVVVDTQKRSADDTPVNSELLNRVKKLEVEGVEEAEKGDFTAAEKLFTQAIELAPERASSYNNRAQARRLLDNIEDAESDLEKALKFSNGTGAVACQAFNQRALIRSLKGDEEGALEDFKRAADLGSQFAKTQTIARNPYAAMCSAMMTEMMEKIRRGEIEG